MTGSGEGDAPMPDAVPDATEPSSDQAVPSAETTGTPLDVGAPVSRPIDATAGDGCSASPMGIRGSAAGMSTLLLVACTTLFVRRRRRACSDRASDCASRAAPLAPPR
jgi:hypothetical protein